MLYKLIPFAVIIVGIIGCGDNKTKLIPGDYALVFHVKEIDIPIDLVVTDSVWYLHNSTETIKITPTWPTSDSFHIVMPLFQTTLAGRLLSNTTMKGHWIDHTRSQSNSTPFDITPNHSAFPTNHTAPTSTKWDCTFSPNSIKDKSRAIGLFNVSGNHIEGTFITETGDYRYLSGETTGQSFHLSCFDGTHLFYFCANIENDSLTHGRFLSGNTWDEEWEGHLDPQAELRDPDSLTTMKEFGKLSFSAIDLQGQYVTFDSTSFQNKVTIVQIFGSWCPNCTDESKFFHELYETHKHENFQIIPVAFEREASQATQLQRIGQQFKELGLSYNPYLGGYSPKSKAEETFPQLNRIFSYPTAIFIDKKSQVRKIHTGFYGPGTGKYYEHHTEQLRMFVDQLIKEN